MAEVRRGAASGEKTGWSDFDSSGETAQKGLKAEQVEIFEDALKRLADVVAKEFGFDFREKPGAGAAGGLGFGLMSFCGATIRPGFDVVAEAVELESKM